MAQPKPLYKIPSQGKVSGVSAGLADYFEIDVTLMRLLMLGAIVFSGFIPGLVVYFVASAIMPDKDKEKKHAKEE